MCIMQKERLYPGDDELKAVNHIIRNIVRKVTPRQCRGILREGIAQIRKPSREAPIRVQERLFSVDKEQQTEKFKIPSCHVLVIGQIRRGTGGSPRCRQCCH